MPLQTCGSGIYAPPATDQVPGLCFFVQGHLQHHSGTCCILWKHGSGLSASVVPVHALEALAKVHGAYYILEVQVYLYQLHLLRYLVPLQTCGSGISAPPAPDQVPAAATVMWLRDICTTALLSSSHHSIALYRLIINHLFCVVEGRTECREVQCASVVCEMGHSPQPLSTPPDQCCPTQVHFLTVLTE